MYVDCFVVVAAKHNFTSFYGHTYRQNLCCHTQKECNHSLKCDHQMNSHLKGHQQKGEHLA